MSSSSFPADNAADPSVVSFEEAPEAGRLSQLLERLGEAPAWAVSAGVHLAVLFVLAGITQVTIIPAETEIVSAIEEPVLDDFKFADTTVVDQVGNDSPLNVVSPSQAAATQTGAEPVEQMEKMLIAEFAVKNPTREFIPEPNKLDLTAAFDAAGTTEHPGGVEGAVDLMTQEIASRLREGETTVVWLFDSSGSMKKRRDAIADRFERVYDQLGQLGVTTPKGEKPPLLTIAASYARTTDLLTPEPVADVRPLAAKVRNIPSDPNISEENVFTAISQVTDKFLSQRTKQNRSMLVIVVTDERGDDYQNLDSLITKLKRYGIRVFCIGNAAPLGREKGLVPYTYPDGFVSMEPVDQGPETVAPELLTLPFWGKGEPDIMSSGYGPYAMTRLCAETGGLFLITEDTLRHHFDPAVMRKYTPDYRPIPQFEADVRSNLAKQAVIAAARASQEPDRIRAIQMPQTVFPAANDAELRQAISQAQEPAAIIGYKLQEYITLLEAGSKHRDRLDTPRWRAVYALAVGRVLALQARALGYNQTLADMKVAPKPFERKNSNQWRLKPSDEITSGPAVKKLAETAREHLARVIDDNPGTPWAELAARELATPLGWSWVEQNDLVVRFGPKANDPQVAQLLLAEEEKKMAERKMAPAGPRREPPKL